MRRGGTKRRGKRGRGQRSDANTGTQSYMSKLSGQKGGGETMACDLQRQGAMDTPSKPSSSTHCTAKGRARMASAARRQSIPARGTEAETGRRTRSLGGSNRLLVRTVHCLES